MARSACPISITYVVDRLTVDVQTKKKRGRSASARTSKERNDNKNEHDDTQTAAKRQRKSATGGRARGAATSAERTLVCCSRPDELNEPCVQCDVCHEWMHCMCENVDWDVVQEMGQYVCCDCQRDDVDRT
jgi:hypothetical protein